MTVWTPPQRRAAAPDRCADHLAAPPGLICPPRQARVTHALLRGRVAKRAQKRRGTSVARAPAFGLGDRPLQVVELLAARRAEPGEQAHVLARLGHFTSLDIELAQILERA